MPPLYTVLPGLPDWFWYPITFLYGAIVGSFVNVVIYRLPLGIFLSRSGSQCPQCNTYLRAWDNIPIVAFLVLRGKCRYCRAPISWRYISIELVTACIWVALYHRISNQVSISWVDYVAQALFASVLVAMIFIDLDHFIAPDELNYIGMALGLGRDLVCLYLARGAGGYLWAEWAPRFSYFNFLPRAIPGALTYGGTLFAVSVIGFVYYAREPGESVGQVLGRFFSGDEPASAATVEGADENAPIPTESHAEALGSVGTDDTLVPDDALEPDAAPPRLRFSPGFLAIVSAALLCIVAGPWGLLALVIPALSFAFMARREGESFSGALRRFFRSDPDDNYAQDIVDLEAAADADQFAREAETGQHGGMGLGDVKLALAVGAILGPALALLSLFVATFLGAATGIFIAVRSRRSLRYGVPFVPFMAMGAIVTMLYGPAFMDWYMGLMSPDRALQTPPAITRPVHPRRRHVLRKR